jgi:hypothetical protein
MFERIVKCFCGTEHVVLYHAKSTVVSVHCYRKDLRFVISLKRACTSFSDALRRTIEGTLQRERQVRNVRQVAVLSFASFSHEYQRNS